MMTKTDLDEKANTRRPHASPDQQYDGVVSSMIGWLIGKMPIDHDQR